MTEEANWEDVNVSSGAFVTEPMDGIPTAMYPSLSEDGSYCTLKIEHINGKTLSLFGLDRVEIDEITDKKVIPDWTEAGSLIKSLTEQVSPDGKLIKVQMAWMEEGQPPTGIRTLPDVTKLQPHIWYNFKEEPGKIKPGQEPKKFKRWYIEKIEWKKAGAKPGAATAGKPKPPTTAKPPVLPAAPPAAQEVTEEQLGEITAVVTDPPFSGDLAAIKKAIRTAYPPVVEGKRSDENNAKFKELVMILPTALEILKDQGIIVEDNGIFTAV